MQSANKPTSAQVDASVNTIPIAFSLTDVASKLITGLSGKLYRRIIVHNESDSRIAVCTSSALVAPSSTSAERFFVPAQASCVFEDIYIQDKIFIQSDTGSTITSGIISVTVY